MGVRGGAGGGRRAACVEGKGESESEGRRVAPAQGNGQRASRLGPKRARHGIKEARAGRLGNRRPRVHAQTRTRTRRGELARAAALPVATSEGNLSVTAVGRVCLPQSPSRPSPSSPWAPPH